MPGKLQVVGCRQRQVDALAVAPTVLDKAELESLLGGPVRVRGVYKEPVRFVGHCFKGLDPLDDFVQLKALVWLQPGEVGVGSLFGRCLDEVVVPDG